MSSTTIVGNPPAACASGTSGLPARLPPPLTLLPHLQKILPEVAAGDPTATRVFLAEALKAASTGKGTSTKDMTETGVWSALDVKTATAERGRTETEASVNAAVAFIERWKQLRPLGTK